ncbi:ATP-binding protein [Motilimonas pumila]|uniref:ATP-binding protein n=1 Tax=Motilimonas pumila TaxID=2303987 RepID=UPI001314C15D|nr:ATP-binding protein [Motilimonas pumila]
MSLFPFSISAKHINNIEHPNSDSSIGLLSLASFSYLPRVGKPTQQTLSIPELEHLSVKINIAFQLNETEEGILLATEMLALANKTGDLLAVAQGQSLLAHGLNLIGQYHSSLQVFNQAAEKYRQLALPEHLLVTQVQLASVYQALDKSHLAQQAMQQAYGLLAELTDEASLHRVIAFLTSMYQQRGDLDTALEYAVELLAYYRQHNEDLIAGSLAQIGILYFQSMQPEKALFYLLEATSSQYELADNLKVSVYLFLAKSYLELNQLSSAKHYARLSEHLLQQQDFPELLALSQLVYGNIANREGDFVLALSYFEQAQAMLERIAAKGHLAQVKLGIATTYYGQKNFSKAISMAQDILQLDLTHSNHERVKLNAYQLLSDVYAQQKDFEQSLVNYRIFHYLANAQHYAHAPATRTIAQVQADVISNEFKLALLTKKHELRQTIHANFQWQRNLVLISLLILAIAGIVAFFSHTKRKQLADLENRLLADTLARKKALMAEVFHDLRTPLSVLKLKLECLEDDVEENKEQAYELLHNRVAYINELLADLYQLAQVNTDVASINKRTFLLLPMFNDLNQQFKALAIAKGLSFEPNLHLAAGASMYGDALRLEQVLSNLLQNSIHYTDAPGLVAFNVTVRSSRCNIVIRDSSPGVSADDLGQLFDRAYRGDSGKSRQQTGSGLGLAICKKYVEMHQGTMQAQHCELGGLQINIELPLKPLTGARIAAELMGEAS